MPRSTINLTPSQNSLQGLYNPGDEVMVMCDATDSDFTVEVPDAQSSDDTLFRFVEYDSSLNEITLSARANQKIMNEDTQVLTEQADELVLNSDGQDWW